MPFITKPTQTLDIRINSTPAPPPRRTTSVYTHLRQIYTRVSPEESMQGHLGILPMSLRQRFFNHAWNLAGRPEQIDETSLLSSLPQAQEAVYRVALETFQSLSPLQKANVERSMWRRMHSYQQAPHSPAELHEWSQNNLQNIPLVLDAMHSSLGNLTPEFERSLDEWVAQAGPGERRDVAKEKIIEFCIQNNRSSLHLVDLGLTSLPPHLEELRDVCELDISHNRLTTFPEQLLELQNLRYLDLTSNRLASLPELASRLPNLERLNLSNNQLTSLPPQIDQLINLRNLDISANRTLQSLPSQVINLPYRSFVDLSGTGLSQQVRNNLRQISNAPGYQGPRFGYSMEHPHHNGNMTPLPTLIANLFAVASQEPHSFPHLEQLSEREKETIRGWLSRLNDTADYSRRGPLQQALAGRIIHYLERADRDEEFRKEFLMLIDGTTRTCGDRVSLSILDVGIASRLRELRERRNIRDLSSFLIHTVLPLEILQELAGQKVQTMPFVDEIEVYLGYPMMLRQRLDLDIDVQAMLFFRCSELTENDLNTATEWVLQQKNNEEVVCAFLSARDDWKDLISERYPNECADIETLYLHKSEEAGEDEIKQAEAFAHKQEAWNALTRRALAETAQSAIAGPCGA